MSGSPSESQSVDTSACTTTSVDTPASQDQVTTTQALRLVGTRVRDAIRESIPTIPEIVQDVRECSEVAAEVVSEAFRDCLDCSYLPDGPNRPTPQPVYVVNQPSVTLVNPHYDANQSVRSDLLLYVFALFYKFDPSCILTGVHAISAAPCSDGGDCSCTSGGALAPSTVTLGTSVLFYQSFPAAASSFAYKSLCLSILGLGWRTFPTSGCVRRR